MEQRRGVWAPYYTLHKILAGLLDVHRVFGNPIALEAAKGMAAWISLRATSLSDAQWQEMLQTEFGGMQKSLTELYAVTRDRKHLRLARLFDHRVVFDPLGRGEDEHFFPVTHFSRHLGESTAETCNTYNMLKLARGLFLRDGLPARIDFYERGLFNHILASNDPATGQVSYYVSMKPGAWRTYSTPGLVLVLRRIKLVADAESDRLVGAHVLAAEGGEIIQEATLAIRFGLKVADIVQTFHPYLTMAEGLKLAALTFDKEVAKLSCCAT